MFAFALFTATALIAYVVTRLSIWFSEARRLVDIPNHRSSHVQPTPRLGGVGIVVSVLVALLLLGLRDSLVVASWIPIALSSFAIALLGIVDDLRELTAARKFLVQALCGLAVVVSGFRGEFLTLPIIGAVTLGAFLGAAISFLWMAGFCNVFNFMDGINGISAGTVIVYSGFLAAMGARLNDAPTMNVCAALAGSALGFGILNFPRARTFMGDAGSLFLGWFLAILAIHVWRDGADPIAILLLFSVYLFDSGFTFLRRLRNRENVFQAHRSHLYQRLVRSGMGHPSVTLIYVFCHIVAGSVALVYWGAGSYVRVLLISGMVLWYSVLALAVARVEQAQLWAKPAELPLADEAGATAHCVRAK